MSERLRAKDDGSEDRPYGSRTLCQTCKFGRVRLVCKHEWRSRLDKPADFGEESGPIRTYHLYSTCLHPDMGVTENGLTVHADMGDVVRCEFYEARAKPLEPPTLSE